MKQALSISLIFTLFLPTLNKINILVDFRVNQDYIARVLCINKEVPFTTCNGSCYLSDQLKKAAKKEQNQPQPLSKEKHEVTYYTSITTEIFRGKLPADIESGFSYSQPLYASLHIHQVFHPPRPAVI